MAVRPEKAAKVAEIKELLESSKAVILVDFKGLTVAEDTALRAKMREAGVKYTVAKNTFIGIAAKEAGIEGMDVALAQNTAIACAPEDPVAVAKIVSEFVKSTNKLKVKLAVLDGAVVDAKAVSALANLPPKEVLLGKMLGSMQAPVTGFVRVLNGTLSKVVYALEAVRKQKESA
ncbi:MAG: 50S ribosomal protein L10 [Acidaminococcaceae bacterium]|nr:50S ribosomal protein L10 [Acidaminococcaceae bacterium]MDO4935322.1 50S ribosomal protein L10 [Phascolarctobacterium sp.]